MTPLAATARDIGELFRDPALTVACVLLIVVSVGWVIITRLIVRNIKKAARRGRNAPRIDAVRPPRDVWSYPP
jgi:cell division protein FtsX